ncbi:MAG: hypothetical protein ACLVEV_06400, partial [Lachnospiraceae bacterium]
MNENYTNESGFDELEERRRARRQKRRRQVALQRAAFFLGLIILAAGVGFAAFTISRKNSGQGQLSAGNGSTGSGGTAVSTEAPRQTEAPTPQTQETAAAPAEPSTENASDASSGSVLEQARYLAAGYDYDGAIELLKTVPSYESDPEISAAISEFETAKASCVAVDVTTVPHIFYHSLINDTDRAFNVSVLGQGQVDGMNAWMTTIEEFDKITQTMYDNGYVFVRLRDLVVESTDANGNVTFSPNTNLMLPPDKKAVVLSID